MSPLHAGRGLAAGFDGIVPPRAGIVNPECILQKAPCESAAAEDCSQCLRAGPGFLEVEAGHIKT